MLLSSIAISVALMTRSPVAPPQDDVVTAEQFLRLVQSQQEAIKDVAFAWEGEKVYVGPPDDKVQKSLRFQGRYALRSDGATYYERFYEGDMVNPSIARSIEAVLGGTAEMAYLTDQEPRITTKKAGPGSFFSETTPEMFTYLWRFQRLNGPADFGYRFLGWEDVDGHRCAHIEFSANPKSPRSGELWVDLERGAHPLRKRNSDGDNTVYLIDQIQLKQFDLPGGEKVWFPVSGRYSQYSHKGNYTKEPAFITTSYVLNGTIAFNQGLSDRVFHVKGDPFRPAFQPKGAAPIVPTAARSKTRIVDFAETEKKLDEALADQARTAQATDAAASTRDEVTSWSWIPWVAGIGGAAVLLAAGWIAWRGRAG